MFSGNAIYIFSLVTILCILGAANSVLMKLTANAFGQDYAFFVDQGNNVLYLLFSVGSVLYKMKRTTDIGAQEYAFPQYKFLLMAAADGAGTFLSSLGAVYTPGNYQTLLNQTLIPVTMVMATCLLRAKYRFGEVFGAMVVLSGASVAVIPSIINPGSAPTNFRVYAAVLYFASNIPMAFSACYKEIGFKDVQLDCFWLTMWVSLYQLFISFAYARLQAIPGFGSENGIHQQVIWTNFWNGLLCSLNQPVTGAPLACSYGGVLLFLYTSVNLI